MKNIKLKTLMLIGVLIAVFAACKGSTNGTFTGSDKQPLNITIAQNEMIKFEKTSRNARTIVAAPFSAKTDLTFYLWGTAQSGQTLTPKTVTVTSEDGVVGKVVLDIDCYNWSLTLAACDSNDLPTAAGSILTESEVLAKAVLIGYGNVDMMFTNSIKFTLTPKGLSKTGGVALTLTLESGMTIPDGYVATAYIYDIITGRAITGSASEDISQTLAKADLEGSGAAYTAKGKQIRPGTYSFQVEFVKANENRKYVWNDTIIILPGKTVTQNIVIPNLIGTKPNAPSSFNVTFNKIDAAGENDNEAEESKYPGFYTAHFSWNGNAVNTEMNFAMQLAEIADVTIGDSLTTEEVFAAVWDVANQSNAQYTFDYLNDIRADRRFYRSGSLFANNTYVDIYLELGKRYIARLFSENNAGYSDPVYITITPVETGAVLNTINRYRVKYYTQGGIWNEGEAHGSETDGSLDKIAYWSQSSIEYTVLNPVYSTISNNVKLGAEGSPYLYNGAADWIYWITDLAASTKYPDATGAVYSPDPYAGYKNLDLGTRNDYRDTNHTLYASITKNNYTITFSLGGGKLGGNANPDNITATYDVAVRQNSEPTKTGYTFTGWNSQADGNGDTYTKNTDIVNLTTTEGTVTLYAMYTANTYTVNFNGNGGEGSMESIVCTYDQDCQLPENAFTKVEGEGENEVTYEIKEWNTVDDGSGNSYKDKAAVKNIATSGEITLYVIWRVEVAYGIEEYIVDDENDLTNIERNTSVEDFIGRFTVGNKYSVQVYSISISEPIKNNDYMRYCRTWRRRGLYRTW